MKISSQQTLLRKAQRCWRQKSQKCKNHTWKFNDDKPM